MSVPTEMIYNDFGYGQFEWVLGREGKNKILLKYLSKKRYEKLALLKIGVKLSIMPQIIDSIYILGYSLSTDYAVLWELINKGYRVPAWLYEEPYWRIVEIKMHKGFYRIGVQGKDYANSGFEPDTIEDLWGVCKYYNIHFVMPQT
jgi:hypothetical protein